MKRITVASVVAGGWIFASACQAIVGISDRVETPPDGPGDGSDGTSGSSSNDASSGGSPSDGSSSGDSSSGSSGSDAGGDASKPYDVGALPGLKLWLESTKELAPGSSGGTPFGTWADQSRAWDAGAAGAPDGGRHIAEPQDVNPPTIVANGIAGRPTVSFVAGNGYVRIAHHSDFQFGLGDFIIVDVAKVASGNGPLWRLAPNATAGTEELFLPTHFCVVFGLGVSNGCTAPEYSAPPGQHVFVARRKGDIFTVRVDGTVRSSLDRSSDPPNISISPFSQPYAFIGNNITMQVSEVIIVVGPTADNDLMTLESHLKTKYGIP